MNGLADQRQSVQRAPLFLQGCRLTLSINHTLSNTNCSEWNWSM